MLLCKPVLNRKPDAKRLLPPEPLGSRHTRAGLKSHTPYFMKTSELRTHIKKQRSQLSIQEQAAYSKEIAERLCTSAFFEKAQTIALYLPVQGEVDTRLIVEKARQAKKSCYLPVLSPEDELHLCFLPFDASTQFVRNRFNIPEPKFDPSTCLQPEDLDLVITPLVAFDKACNRMGMGLGFYDRTFQFLLIKPRADRPVLCGLAYGFQEVASTDPQPWDVSLNYVITENRLFSPAL